LPDGTNPIKKIPLVITGNEGEVYMDEIPDGIVGNNSNGVGVGAGNNGAVVAGGGLIDRQVQEQLLTIHSQLNGLRRSDEELRTDIQNDRITATRWYQTLNLGISPIALQSARRVPQNENNVNQPQQNKKVAAGSNGGVAALSPT
jgi:hypothetical protein